MPEAKKDRPTVFQGCSRGKAEGAFLALAAGDALGWPQEIRGKTIGPGIKRAPSVDFHEWARRGGGRFYPHEELIGRGEYSDDTQLTLAVARCRLIQGAAWWTVFTRLELPLWTMYERGGGGATKRAAQGWLKGTPPWASDARSMKAYFAAGGNGVAMRVLPHSVFYSGFDNARQLIRDVISDGVATHGHPRALLGATSFAYAAWWLLRLNRTIRFGELVDVLLENSSVWSEFPTRGDTKNGWYDAANRSTNGGFLTLWDDVSQEMKALLNDVRRGLSAGAIADDDEILDHLGCFGKSKGAGTISAAAAAYLCARYAPQPSQGVVRAAFARGADTDTLAAMTGGLMGCLAGSEWLPSEWFSVQDCDYLRRLANLLAQGPDATEARSGQTKSIGQNEIDAILDKIDRGTDEAVDLGGGRKASVIGNRSWRPLSKTTIANAWHIKTNDGQTIIVTKVGRRGKDEAKEPNVAESGKPKHTEPALCEVRGVKVTVRNLDATTSFYEKVLGLQKTETSATSAAFGVLQFTEEMFVRETRQHERQGMLEESHIRFVVYVGDLELAYRRASNAGSVVEPRQITKVPEDGFVCRDPEGNYVEVHQARAWHS